MILNKIPRRQHLVLLFSTILGLIIILAIAFTPFRLLSLLATTALWAAYWPLPKRANSLLFRYMLAFTMFTVSLQLYGAVAWLLNFKLTTPVVVVGQLIILAAAWYLLPHERRRKPKFINSHDYYSLAITVVTLAILCTGTLARGPAFEGLLRYITSGFDNVAHLSISLSLYKEQGYIYGSASSIESRLLSKDLAGYPLGWHLNNAVWWRTLPIDLNQTSTNPKPALYVYFATLMFWFGILLFFFCRVMLLLIDGLSNGHVNNHLAGIGAFAFTGFASAAFMFGLLREGFADFIPILSYFLVLIVFISSGLDNNEVVAPAKRNSALLINGLLISGGVAFSWLLAAPAAYISLLLAVILLSGGLKSFANAFFRQNLTLMLSELTLFMLGCTEGFFQILYNIKPNHINEDAQIGSLNLLLLALSIIASLCVTNRLAQRAAGKFKENFLVVSSGSFALFGIIYLYQSLTVGKTTYYGTKVGFITLLIVMVFGSSVLIYAILSAKRINAAGFIPSIFVFIAAISILLVSTNVDPQYVKFAFGGVRDLDPTTAHLVAGHLHNGDFKNGNALVIRQQNFREDIVTTLLIQDISRRHDVCTETTVHALLKTYDQALLYKGVLSCAQTEHTPYYVITSRGTNPILLSNLQNIPNVIVLKSN